MRVKGRKMVDFIRNLDIYRDYSEDGYFILFDQAKAFDRVNHDYLFKITKTLYSNMTSQEIINGEKTDKFLIDQGVRQGCPYIMLLFTPLIEMIIIIIRNR